MKTAILSAAKLNCFTVSKQCTRVYHSLHRMFDICVHKPTCGKTGSTYQNVSEQKFAKLKCSKSSESQNRDIKCSEIKVFYIN